MHLVGLQMPNCTIGPDQFRALSDPPAAGRYEGGRSPSINVGPRWGLTRRMRIKRLWNLWPSHSIASDGGSANILHW